MMPPGVAAGRFGAALLLGAGLGLCYAFLRPPGRRRWPGDLCFLLCALWAWVQLAFRICRGDMRGPYLLGLAAGAWVANLLFRPLFADFWKIMAIPAKKILIFRKKVFASG